MKLLEMSGKFKGMFTMVDDDVYDYLNQWRWGIDIGSYVIRNKYLYRKNGKNISKLIFIHHIIKGRKEGYDIDHINGNRLDNRIENLRFATRSQNKMNAKVYKNNKLGLKGVHFVEKTHKFRASITLNKKKSMLGTFKTKEEAARAYDKKAKELFGEFALLNFK